MPRDAVAKHRYVNVLTDRMETFTSQFGVYNTKLQDIFTALDGYIVDEDTPPEMVSVLIAKKAQGIALIQNMLNGQVANVCTGNNGCRNWQYQ